VRKLVFQQATLLNVLLRTLVTGRLYDQAWKLLTKTTFPEIRSNAEYARYLFYVGKVKAIRLEYSEAFSKLSQAVKKAPKSAGSRGFRLVAQKLAIIVEMLMGDIPDRTVFNDEDEGLKRGLAPYLALARAVRSGDAQRFRELVGQWEGQFRADDTLSLIHRLHHNVIKAGLGAIIASYSRISIAEVQKRLGLASVDEAVGIAAKAIVDGVIDAQIDLQNQVLESSWTGDVYSSPEPQSVVHKRIGFLLQVHTDALKAMSYPEKLLPRPKAVLPTETLQAGDEDDEEEDEDDDMML
jgi:26S proteasome regulatory subunit N3